MTISNYKTIYENVAIKLGIDKELVEKIGSFVWKDLNVRLANFQNREMYMFRLGSFRFRKRKGEQLYNSLKLSKQSLPSNPMLSDEQKVKGLQTVDEKLGAVRNLLDEWEDLLAQKQTFKKRLNEDPN